jgi:hypothetical protein
VRLSMVLGLWQDHAEVVWSSKVCRSENAVIFVISNGDGILLFRSKFSCE